MMDRAGKTFTAIVLAGGKGSRMKSAVAKQYLELKGHPILYYTLKAFEESPVDSIILVCGASDVEFCEEQIVKAGSINKVKAIVPGGKERYDSVWQGLLAAGDADYVLIHDGARPFVDNGVIEACMEDVLRYDACVAAVPVKDTIKVVDENLFTKETPDRKLLWGVQTPQTFRKTLVYDAYKALQADLAEKGADCMPVSITDDTMVVQYYTGTPSHMSLGSYNNIKITTPEDLVFAEAILGDK